MNRAVSLHVIADELGADVNELEAELSNEPAYDPQQQTLPAWAAVHLLPERSLLRHHLCEFMQPNMALDAAFAGAAVADDAATNVE